MPITLAEFEEFQKSVDSMKHLRSIPLEIIEFYLENEHGYIVRRSQSDEEKIVLVQPSRLPGEGKSEGASGSR